MQFKKIRKKFLISMLFVSANLVPAIVGAQSTQVAPDAKVYQMAAQVDIKLDFLSKKKADIILKIPTQQAYGFMGEAETPEQKITVDSVVDGVRQNINNIVGLDPSLECKREINRIDSFEKSEAKYEKSSAAEKEKITSEFPVLKVDLTLNCVKILSRRKLKIDFSQNFRNIDKILVNLDSKKKRKFVIHGPSGDFTL